MKKYLTALAFFGVSMTLGLSHAAAQSVSDSAKPAVKTVKKKTKKAPAKKADPAPLEAIPGEEDDGVPDITASTVSNYQCEFGNKITTYQNPGDDRHIALRWNKQLLRLTRVDTTTGANRFENRKFGLVWIDIPAKGMLLDSKKGQQLANECKTPEQMKP